MADTSQNPCRKCGTLNPVDNAYCRSCGAFLAVLTAAIKAQGSPIEPVKKGIRLRFIALSAVVILGLMTILFTLFIVAVWLLLDMGPEFEVLDSGSVIEEFFGVVIVGVTLFLLAFGSAGLAIAWMAKGRVIAEIAIAAVSVNGLLAFVGCAVTGDALYVAAALVVPATALAGLGGKIGEVWFAKERTI